MMHPSLPAITDMSRRQRIIMAVILVGSLVYIILTQVSLISTQHLVLGVITSNFHVIWDWE